MSECQWRLTALQDVASDVTVGYVGPMATEYVERGIPFLRSLNVEALRIKPADLKYITPEFHQRLSKSSLTPGDVVIVRTGKPGACAVIPDWLAVANCSDLVIVRTGPELNPYFLAYYVNSAASHHVASHLVGAVQQHFNVASAKSMQLHLPPRWEQDAIAQVLRHLDDKIELNRKMNETLEAMARAIFKSWFVDFHPVRAKAEGRDTGLPAHIATYFPDSFVDSDLGEIPYGWRATTLGKETERHGGRIQTGPFGSQLHASDYSTDGVPVIMPQDIVNRRVSTACIARVRESDAERLSRHRVQPGDIIYSRRGDVERHAQISERETGWLCGTGCLLVRMGPHWPPSMFMSLALDRPESRAWITQHAIGATMPNLNTGILSAIPLMVPPDDILQAFARLAEPIEQNISAKNAECHSLESLRDALLPKLVSGELRCHPGQRLR